MDDLAEKRVFGDRGGATALVVATAPGLVTVSVADDRVGGFGLARRCAPADVAAGGGRLLVATDEDVLLTHADVDALEPTGFGPASAVTLADGRPVALAPDWRLGVHGGDGWTDRGEIPAAPTSLDGDLVGTDGGVFRLADDGLVHAGLSGVVDVAHVAGVPLAATPDGLYELGNGWLDALDGDVRAVAGTADGRAHAATADGLFERRGVADWARVDLPTDDRVVAVAHGEQACAVTAGGDLLLEGADGDWRLEPLGLEAPVALAVR